MTKLYTKTRSELEPYHPMHIIDDISEVATIINK